MITQFCVGLPVIIFGYLLIYLYSRFFFKFIVKESMNNDPFPIKYILAPMLAVIATILAVGAVWLVFLCSRELGVQIIKSLM